MSLTLQNQRLKNEVYELRRLLSLQENIIPAESTRDDVILQLHEDLDGQERVEALEKEIIRAKDVLDGELHNLRSDYFSIFYSSSVPYLSSETVDEVELKLIRFSQTVCIEMEI